jgi:hypothetical protein
MVKEKEIVNLLKKNFKCQEKRKKEVIFLQKLSENLISLILRKAQLFERGSFERFAR